MPMKDNSYFLSNLNSNISLLYKPVLLTHPRLCVKKINAKKICSYHDI